MSSVAELPRRLLRVNEVAECLNVSRSAVYALMSRGDLPYVLVGRCRRVKPESVASLIEAGSVGMK